MKALATVWKKELLELVRDRRTLMLTLLFAPLLGPLLFMGLATMGESKAKELLSQISEEGANFHVLAMEHSQDENTRHVGGYAGRLTRSQVTGAVEAAVFKAKAGAVIAHHVRELRDHVAHVAALVGTGVQLAVTVRAGAAFSEAVVAIAVYLAARVQRFEIVTARLHELPAIQHVRENAVARQLVSAEQTRGAVAHDQHARTFTHFAQRLAAERRSLFGVRQRDLEMKAHPAAARIERALFYRDAWDLLGRDAELGLNQAAQARLVLGVVQA